MSASTSKAPAKSTTRGSSHKRKRSEEVDTPRTRPSTAPQLQSVDCFTEEVPPIISEGPSMNRGNGNAQSRKAGCGVDPDRLDPPISTEASTVATETRSFTLLQGSSNFQISNTKFTTIGGNATIFQFGHDQFTEAQRNLVCRICTCRSKYNSILVDL
ncbi:hypothetical protein JOM56_004981 [Amanita muscaria]